MNTRIDKQENTGNVIYKNSDSQEKDKKYGFR